MANQGNLVPNEARTPTERRENARKAGIASGESRRRKKLLREALEELLEREYYDKDGNSADGTTVLATKVFKKAMDGDLRAFELIRDTVGQKPVERVESVEIPQETYERVWRALSGE
jgi:hypothetical protein